MTANELNTYINKVLGNSIRCLLPSYWWKRLLTRIVEYVESIEKKFDRKLENVDQKINATDEVVSELSDNVSSIRGGLDSLNSRVDTNYSNLEDARVRLFDLENEVDTLNEKVDNFNVDVDLSDYATKNELESLSDDLVELSNEVNKKGTYSKPDSGIPKSDLSSDVQEALDNIGKSSDMPIVAHSYNEQEVEIIPNVYHKWNGSVSLLTITFLNASSDYVQNYLFEFKTSSNGCELTLPTDLKWVNGNPPAIKANVFYQISVVNNLGVWACYE